MSPKLLHSTEQKQLKEKYSKQGKLLDTEQLESKRLEEENEKLQAQVKELEQSNSRLIRELANLNGGVED